MSQALQTKEELQSPLHACRKERAGVLASAVLLHPVKCTEMHRSGTEAIQIEVFIFFFKSQEESFCPVVQILNRSVGPSSI